MRIDELIKFEKDIYVHYSRPDFNQAVRTVLKLTRDQGKLPELCSSLGISLRSIQRWVPTPYKQIKIKGEPPPPKKGQQQLIPDEVIPTFHIKRKRRKNWKGKVKNISQPIEYLLQLALLSKCTIPDKEPTNKEIMKLVLRYKKSIGTWKEVCEKLCINNMLLYRFRKTGKMKKSHRVLLYILLSEAEF